MAVTEHRIADEFGQVTVFTGEELIFLSSDDGRRPRWNDTTVWRTQGGKYVVWTETSYRIRHLSPYCPKAIGYDLAPSDEEDTAPCKECNPTGLMGPGFSQQSRSRVLVHDDPKSFIESMPPASNFTRLLLSKLSEVDEAIKAQWAVQVVD